MDNRIRLLELQQTWVPPQGLERSRPRPVCLTAAGKALCLLAVLLLLGALAAGVALGMLAQRQAEQQRLLREQGLETQARITHLWRSRNDNRQPWVAYRFTVRGRCYERRTKAPLRVWRNLQMGSELPVRYLPSDPQLNHPAAWRAKTVPLWLPYLAAGVLGALGWIVTLSLRGQRRLLVEGRPAPAVVTRHTRSKDGKTVHYEFPLLSGAIRQGRSGPTKKPPAVGSVICVLYAPDNPRRNAAYPLSLVKLC